MRRSGLGGVCLLLVGALFRAYCCAPPTVIPGPQWQAPPRLDAVMVRAGADSGLYSPSRLPEVVAHVPVLPGQMLSWSANGIERTSMSGQDLLELGFALDLNLASAADLEALAGAGPVLAGRIVAWRVGHGGFCRPSELLRVHGVGPKRFGGWSSQVKTEQGTSPARSACDAR